MTQQTTEKSGGLGVTFKVNPTQFREAAELFYKTHNMKPEVLIEELLTWFKRDLERALREG